MPIYFIEEKEQRSTLFFFIKFYYGKFINKYIYDPIERGFVKERLDELNVLDGGKRKARFHQWLTEFGKKQLVFQIGQITGIMATSPNKRRFEESQSRQIYMSLLPEDL